VILPTAFLSGTGAATGIGLIAAVGNLGGFAGLAFTRVMEESTGGCEVPLTGLAGLLVVGALVVLLAREERFYDRARALGDGGRAERAEPLPPEIPSVGITIRPAPSSVGAGAQGTVGRRCKARCKE
jgi:hypothetical protein